jgi:hypothetical protein
LSLSLPLSPLLLRSLSLMLLSLFLFVLLQLLLLLYVAVVAVVAAPGGVLLGVVALTVIDVVLTRAST